MSVSLSVCLSVYLPIRLTGILMNSIWGRKGWCRCASFVITSLAAVFCYITTAVQLCILGGIKKSVSVCLPLCPLCLVAYWWIQCEEEKVNFDNHRACCLMSLDCDSSPVTYSCCNEKYLSVCLSVSPTIHLFIHPSIYWFIDAYETARRVMRGGSWLKGGGDPLEDHVAAYPCATQKQMVHRRLIRWRQWHFFS